MVNDHYHNEKCHQLQLVSVLEEDRTLVVRHRVLTRSVGLGYGHVHDSADVLRLGRGSSEAADARLRWCAGGQTVSVVVGSCRHLLRGSVRDEALRDRELSVPQLLLHLGVFISSGQLLVSGRGAFC